jgi:hypothetical protein
MQAIRLLGEALGLPPSSLKMGDGELVTYCQPMKKSWLVYSKYAFKTVEGQSTGDESKQEIMCKVKREFIKKRGRPPSMRDMQAGILKELGGKDNLVVYAKHYSKLLPTFMELSELIELSSDEEPATKKRCDVIEPVEKCVTLNDVTTSVGHTVKMLMSGDLLKGSRATKTEMVAALFVPLLYQRSEDDKGLQCTRTPYLIGASGAGKSYLGNCLADKGLLTRVPTDADGCGRYEMQAGSRGMLMDDVSANWYMASNNTATLKALTSGETVSIKTFGTKTQVRGWVYVTSQVAPTVISSVGVEQDAFRRRFIAMRVKHDGEDPPTHVDITHPFYIDFVGRMLLYLSIHFQELQLYAKTLDEQFKLFKCDCEMFDTWFDNIHEDNY